MTMCKLLLLDYTYKHCLSTIMTNCRTFANITYFLVRTAVLLTLHSVGKSTVTLQYKIQSYSAFHSMLDLQLGQKSTQGTLIRSHYCTVVHVAIVSQVDGALDVTPVNTAVFSGQRVVLRCHSDSGNSGFVAWSRRLVGGTDEAIVGGCNVVVGSSVYDVSKSDNTGQCDLVINSVDTSLTGLYTCTDLITQVSAYVTIIGQLLNMLLWY